MKTFSTLAAFALSLLTISPLQAQEPEAKIALTPYVIYEIESVPSAALSSLQRKLTSMATANGFAGTSDTFLLTGVPTVTDVSMTPTAPAQFVVTMDVEVYVVNSPEEVIVAQTVYSVKGVGASEQKAIIGAINQINVKSIDTRRFMENARTKIIDYYAGRLPSIIAKAQSMASMKRYDEALAVLSAVPECLDEYPQVADLMVDIYTKRIDLAADSLIRSASAKLAMDDTDAALADLVKIDPYSTLAAKADAIVSDIKAKADAEKQAELQKEIEAYEYERELALKKYEDEIELMKKRLELAKEVSSAAGNIAAGGAADTAGAVVKTGSSLAKLLLGNLVK